MYKHIRYKLLVLLTAVIAAACESAGEPELENADDTVTVSFSIDAEDIVGQSAMAGARGDNVPGNIDRLVFAVYDVRDNLLSEMGYENGQIVMDVDRFPVNIELTLVKKQQYKIAVWAQSSKCEAFETSDLSAVTVDYSQIPTDSDVADAFCKSEVFTAVADGIRRIVLKRPLARVEFLMYPSDFELVESSFTPIQQVQFSGSWMPNTINVLSGGIVENTGVTPAVFPKSPVSTRRSFVQLGEGHETPDEGYIVLASAFVGAPSEMMFLNDLAFEMFFQNGNSCLIPVDKMPVQRNYSTNILISAQSVENQSQLRMYSRNYLNQ